MTDDQHLTDRADSDRNQTITDDPEPDVTDILGILDENDGNPTALADHRKVPYVLADWKHSDDFADQVKYQKVDDEINWRAVNMSTSMWEDMLANAHADQTGDEAAADREQKDIAAMTPQEVREAFNWDPMMDREIAAKCHEWCKGNADIIYTNGQVMVLEDDIWVREETRVAKTLRNLVGKHYGDNVKQEFIKGYVKVDDDYRIDWDEVGIDGHKCVVKNGILNLVTGEIEGDVGPDDYAVMKFPVKWEGMDTEATRFRDDFLARSVVVDDRKKLQEFAGYCLHTNEYPYKKALMMLGDGNNGKGVYEQILVAMLGSDNTMHDDLKDLSDNQFGAQRLRENAANINSDIDGNRIKNTSMFKKLTGRDPIRVEPKFETAYEIKNPAKLVFAANEVPKVKDAVLAFYARWMFVHFPNKFTTHEGDGYLDADPHIQDDIIEEELSGVLAWAVEGYQRLHEQEHFTGEQKPAEVRDQWYDYADTTATFVRNHIKVGSVPPESRRDRPWTPGEIYNLYEKYIETTPTSPRTKQSLSNYITNRYDGAETKTSRKYAPDDKEVVRIWDSIYIPDASIDEIRDRYKKSL